MVLGADLDLLDEVLEEGRGVVLLVLVPLLQPLDLQHVGLLHLLLVLRHVLQSFQTH